MVTTKISNVNYRVVHGKKIDLVDFAKNTWGAVMKACSWRIMYYDGAGEFTCNVFSNGKLNFFTNRVDTDFVATKVSKLLTIPRDDIHVSISAIVMTVDLNITVNLDKFFTNNQDDDIYNCHMSPTKTHDVMYMNKQDIPGIIIDVFKDDNIGITLYSSGKLISYGLHSQEDIDRLMDYVHTRLYPMAVAASDGPSVVPALCVP